MPINPRVNTTPNQPPAASRPDQLSTRQVVVATSWREPALSACSQAGLVNNLNDGLAWGLLPLLFVRGGLSVGQVGLLAALYPAVWGLGQLVTGPVRPAGPQAPHHRRHAAPGHRAGRHAVAGSFLSWAACAILLGAGTAMVYPPCWPPSATSPTPAGAPPRSASTGCGATPASPWALLAGVVPTSPAWRPPCGWSPPSPPPPAWSLPGACTRPTDGAGRPRTPLRFATFLAPNMLPVYRFLADRIGHRLGRRVELVVGRSFDQFEQARPTWG